MFRFFLLNILIFFCYIPAVFAKETVAVRAGEHDGYSRLVFDWPNTVSYTLKKDDSGKLTVNFQSGGQLDKGELKDKIAKNVASLKVISEDPLSVDLMIPADSKTRDFQAGNRVLIDIYDGSAQPADPVVKIEPQGQPVPEKKTPAAVHTQTYGPPQKILSSVAIKDAAALRAVLKKVNGAIPFGPPAPLKKERIIPQIVTAQAPDTKALASPKPVAPVQAADPALKISPQTDAANLMGPSRNIKKIEEPTIISMSAIDSIDLAVFERGHKIWMVSHLQNLLLRPQVTGPRADSLLPASVNDKDVVKTFQFNDPQNVILRAQGGGVLWRILVANAEDVLPKEKTAPIEPVVESDGKTNKIIWPLKELGKIADIKDPVSGKILKVVTVRSGEQFAGPAHDFVEFETLPSPLGLTILPKVDDLQVILSAKGVEISRSLPLNFTSADDAKIIIAEREKMNRRPKINPSVPRIFNFNEWQMGGLDTIEQNKNIILGNLPTRPSSQKTQGILSLAKMYLSHGMWAESLGFLNFAQNDVPELQQNPEFMALRGAAEALGLESDQAFNSFSAPELKIYPEVDYWRALAVAQLGDWQQAADIMPKDLAILADYPPPIINRLSLVLAEIALRQGDRDKGRALLAMVQDEGGALPVEQKAALDYLKGELARQDGKLEETKKLWEPLTNGSDNQFKVKAGVALTRLLSEQKKITLQEAINRLEHLRYSWRGDELEAQVNYWLGHTYFQNESYIKGLKIMRDAAGYSAGTDLGDMVAAEMSQAFSDLFLSPRLEKVSAVDAAVIYNEFAELIPPGEKGDQIASRLVDHLVKYDLLAQAETLLQKQFDRRLQGAAAYDGGVRLAAIYLLDKKPVNAITVLNKTEQILQRLPADQQTALHTRKISLLRARALSEQNKSDDAMALLDSLGDTNDVNRLRADIAWRASAWDDAAEALGYVVTDQNISPVAKPSADDAALLLRYAIALNLSNDRIALSNLREKYGPAMEQSDKARVFEMVTRSWQTALLQDRQALIAMVSEVDLFENFLNNSGGAANVPGTAPAATPPATP